MENNKCYICGNESQEYLYCEDCFKKIENDETAKCNLCNKQYLKGSRCKCIVKPIPDKEKTNQQTNNNFTTKSYNQPQNVSLKPIQEPKEEGSGCNGCLKAFLITLLIISIIIGMGYILVKCQIENQLDKVSNAPEITSSTGESITDLTEIKVKIKCKANYDFVEIELCLYDKNENIIKKTTLRGEDYRRGQTYILSYKLTTNEIFNAKKYGVRIKDYD